MECDRYTSCLCCAEPCPVVDRISPDCKGTPFALNLRREGPTDWGARPSAGRDHRRCYAQFAGPRSWGANQPYSTNCRRSVLPALLSPDGAFTSSLGLRLWMLAIRRIMTLPVHAKLRHSRGWISPNPRLTCQDA